MTTDQKENVSSQEETKHKEPKPFFYYPKHKRTNKSRKTVAGLVIAGKLYLGVSQSFAGHKKRPTKDGKEWEMPMAADQFTKKMGREIAVGRALRGCEDCDKKGLRFVVDIPEETLKEGALGKFFVAEVEKRFKPMKRKAKPGTAKTTDAAHPDTPTA